MTADRARIIRLVVAFALLIVAVYVFGWYIPQFYEQGTTSLWAEALYIGVAAMGLNLLTGYNGQVSIGHGAFFGLGMYTTAILMQSHDWSFTETLPVVAALSFGVGVLVGFPALRVKGLYLALVTLGLAVLFPQLTNRFVPHDLCKTCGTSQVGELKAVKLLPPSWTPTFIKYPDQWAYYATLTIAVIGIVAMYLIVRSRFGRALIAVRDHEAAAETVGINIARVKVVAFATSALYAGVAGSCFVLVKRLATASSVSVFQFSIEFLVAVVIGGTATVLGPFIGGIIVVFTGRWISESFPSTILFWHINESVKNLLSPAIFGIGLILLMYVLPDGIVGGGRRILNSRLRSLRRGKTSPAST
ncbi:MAG: branched-chain amino acid transport system permease protein [Actinomycetota bacterium]|nr:branched-chain amino acid transport system permease protein [Actinomycetota bacterium]